MANNFRKSGIQGDTLEQHLPVSIFTDLEIQLKMPLLFYA
jgi:hypothetical protein